MSDMLDTHEISINNDSQELNFSLTNSNNALLEEFSVVERNFKNRLIQKNNNNSKKPANGIKENKILLSHENLLISKNK